MYLSINDEVLIKRQKEVEQINEKIISTFDALPFWQKWGKTEKIKQIIIENWKNLEIFQNRRMREELSKDNFFVPNANKDL